MHIESESSFDVVVVGGGIAGCCAAIEAARAGASVCLASASGVFSGSSFYPGTWGLGLVGPRDASDIDDMVETILHVGRGAQLVRAAGQQAQLMAKEGAYAQVRLPSGEYRLIKMECRAVVGQIGNEDHGNIHIGKAGRKRHMGIRPTVRGSVMNPNDHPHGGGEGRAPIGRPGPVTPWGKPALGYKTRKKKNRTEKFIVRHRNAK